MTSRRQQIIAELKALAEMPEDQLRERELTMQILWAERKVLVQYERMAALPFAERARGCSPPASAERIFGDAAMAERIAEQQRKIARHEAELGLAPGA